METEGDPRNNHFYSEQHFNHSNICKEDIEEKGNPIPHNGDVERTTRRYPHNLGLRRGTKVHRLSRGNPLGVSKSRFGVTGSEFWHLKGVRDS